MALTHTRLTNAQYLERLDDGKRYELHEGVLIEMPSPTPLHNWIVSVLLHLLMLDVFHHKRGHVFADNLDYFLDSGVILKPDVSFVAAGRFTVLPQRFDFAPDLAVEVLSPSNTAIEMNYKVKTYLHYGTSLVWVIDPENQLVTVYRKGTQDLIHIDHLTITDTLSGGDLLPEFRASLRQVFGETSST